MIAGLNGRIARRLPQPVLRAAFDLLKSRTPIQRSMAGQIGRIRAGKAWSSLDPSYASVRTGGTSVLARTVRRFSGVEAAGENAGLAAAAAESAGVPYRIEEDAPRRGLRLVAAAEDLHLIERQLQRQGKLRPLYTSDGYGSGPMLLRDAVPGQRLPEVFEYRAAEGLVLAGPELACRLLAAGAEPPHLGLADVVEPVDIVYTWVDGTDPAWARQREMAWARIHPNEVNPYAANAERYRSHDELRYSLRSVDYFAPWINHIYLVTAGQVPEWLDLANSRITVVDHREIFPAEALPTFNSHAIEARLHRIPGLSEHFLYLNDDVFFGRSVGPERFFHGNGLTKFFLSKHRIPLGGISAADLPVDSAAKRNRQLLQDKFGRTVEFKFKHTAHAQRRSVLERIEEDFPAEHASTTHSRFRDPQDISIPSSLAHYYGYAIGTAVADAISYRFCEISAPDAQVKLLRLLGDRSADVFCLNETGPAALDWDRLDAMLEDFLKAYFPVPSSFELGAE